MNSWRSLLDRLGRTVRPASRENELVDELSFHLESRAADLEAQGLTRDAARRKGRLEFGSVEKCKEQYREIRSLHGLEMLLRELKFAVRSLAAVKGLFVTVALTLALGIGANAAIFSVVRGVLLRPLVNRDESRLLYVRQSPPGVGVA